MVAKDNKTKQAEYKDRMRKSGFTQIAMWVHQDDKERVRRYVRGLNKSRFKCRT